MSDADDPGRYTMIGGWPHYDRETAKRLGILTEDGRRRIASCVMWHPHDGIPCQPVYVDELDGTT